MNRPSDYKVVRTSSPPKYFQSYVDACDDAQSGLEDAQVVALYSSPNIDIDRIKELQTPCPGPLGNQEIQKRIAELQDEIMALTYKVLGDPGESITSTNIFNPFSSGTSSQG